MQRDGAIAYLKELLGTDIDVSPDSVSIEKQLNSNAVEIRIKINDNQRQRIKDIAKKRDLLVKEEGASTLIYED